jgi:Fe-S cluster assembly protein SufD
LVGKGSGGGLIIVNVKNRGTIDWYVKRFADYEQSRNRRSLGALHRLRKAAIDQFASQGFPSTKDEEWKYTNLAGLARHHFDPLGKPVHSKKSMPTLFEELDMITLMFVNSRFVASQSNEEKRENTIELQPLSTLKEQDLVSLLSPERDVFPALNMAFFMDGIYINVPEDCTVNQPVHLVHITDSAGQNVLNQPRVIVKVGKNAKLDIIETYMGLDGHNYFTNSLSSFTVGANARIGHYRIQLEGINAHHISTTRVDLAYAGNFVSHAILFGSRLNRNDMHVTLAGEEGDCTLNGLYVANGQQHIDNRTVIAHTKAHGQSTQIYKGILDNDARGVFNGKIHVHPNAQKTNAIQSSNALLLSDNTTINTKPQLEIYADDVRCTHGAAVGQLDKEAFFYLRSRGIDQEKARNMLIYAFAGDILEKMALEPVKRWVKSQLVDKLDTLRPA